MMSYLVVYVLRGSSCMFTCPLPFTLFRVYKSLQNFNADTRANVYLPTKSHEPFNIGQVFSLQHKSFAIKQCHIFAISVVQVIPSFSQANLPSLQRSTVSQQVNKFNFNAIFNARKICGHLLFIYIISWRSYFVKSI